MKRYVDANSTRVTQLEVKRSTRKHELKRLIFEQLVDEDVFYLIVV